MYVTLPAKPPKAVLQGVVPPRNLSLTGHLVRAVSYQHIFKKQVFGTKKKGGRFLRPPCYFFTTFKQCSVNYGCTAATIAGLGSGCFAAAHFPLPLCPVEATFVALAAPWLPVYPPAICAADTP